MKKRRKPLVIDLFAGCGGLTEGFKNAGFKVVAAVEYDKNAAKTYRVNHPEVALLEDDITNPDIVAHLERLTGGNNVDVVIGGPPCQSFSLIGRAKDPYGMENDPRNRLVNRYAEIVEHLNPKFLVMENVPGILNARYGSIYKNLMNRLKRLGYIVHSDKLNAAHYGVPQLRNRIIFIGNRLDIGAGCSEDELKILFYPEKTHWAPYYWHSIELAEPKTGEKHLKRFLTLRDAVHDLPEVEAGSGDSPCRYNSDRVCSEYQELMRIDAPKGWIYNHVARYNNPNDLKRYGTLKPGQIARDLPKRLRIYRDDIFDDKFKRQSWDRPSTTIVAHMHKDGNMFIHPGQVRSLTAREAARIQSFSDGYIFDGPTNNWYKQIGNAVPPLMAQAIASHIKKLLNETVDYGVEQQRSLVYS